jgi:hypothetical protein
VITPFFLSAFTFADPNYSPEVVINLVGIVALMLAVGFVVESWERQRERSHRLVAPIRPRLQLHLSTLLIVTLLAAGLVWLNVRERALTMHCRGWPWMFELSWHLPASPEPEYRWFTENLLKDIASCLALLAVAAAAIEWATRRMKRKPQP